LRDLLDACELGSTSCARVSDVETLAADLRELATKVQRHLNIVVAERRRLMGCHVSEATRRRAWPTRLYPPNRRDQVGWCLAEALRKAVGKVAKALSTRGVTAVVARPLQPVRRVVGCGQLIPQFLVAVPPTQQVRPDAVPRVRPDFLDLLGNVDAALICTVGKSSVC
jgi:hypothetical protein